MSAPPPDLAFVQQALEAAPFHRWLGLTVSEIGADEIRLSMPWRDEVVSNPKVQAALQKQQQLLAENKTTPFEAAEILLSL